MFTYLYILTSFLHLLYTYNYRIDYQSRFLLQRWLQSFFKSLEAKNNYVSTFMLGVYKTIILYALNALNKTDTKQQHGNNRIFKIPLDTNVQNVFLFVLNI